MQAVCTICKYQFDSHDGGAICEECDRTFCPKCEEKYFPNEAGTTVNSCTICLFKECQPVPSIQVGGEVGRRIVCAANRKNGVVVLGARHFDNLMRGQIRRAFWFKALLKRRSIWCHWEQGFVDQQGVWLTREEAWKIAVAAGQILRRVGGDTNNGGSLDSSNLY